MNKYQTLSEIDHILKRPETFVGTLETTLQTEYVAKGKITLETIQVSEALTRTFVEVLANAIDNAILSNQPTTYIRIQIYKNGKTCITNDGDIIPIDKDNEKGIYNHELVFGHLRTSSNYNDDIQRETSGKNGIGVKCVNILSKYFKVVGTDAEKGLKFEQVWENNMKDTKGPIITPYKGKNFTQVEYIPDFKYFKKEGYSKHILQLFKKHAIDAAFTCKIPITWGDKVFKIPSFKDYINLYDLDVKDSYKLNIVKPQFKSELQIILTEAEANHVSFVNRLLTKNNGSHVNSVIKILLNGVADKLKVSERDIKPYFLIFTNLTIDKPSFDGQNKNKLTTTLDLKYDDFRTIIAKISKSTFLKTKVAEILELKAKISESKLIRTINKPRDLPIDNYDKANNAGTKYSTQCVLILCEGLSAKTFAVSGIEKGIPGVKGKGRDWFGILPLKGKFLNVRNVTKEKMVKNAVVMNIIQALGLTFGIEYKSLDTLKYGKILILPDPDTDGIHIEGLILNFFHHYFPSLLKHKSFIQSMKIPIIKTSKQEFYSEQTFKHAHPEGCKDAKYFKGLGTVAHKDVPNVFGKKMVEYFPDQNTDISLNKAFKDEFSDQRKQWLMSWVQTIQILDEPLTIIPIPITSFIDEYLIQYSIDDCKRSLPNIMDGLKESQRKVIYGVRKTTTLVKVAQLAGFVAQKTDYKHGEQNLCETIIKMAQNFVGSNNIPLLFQSGQFGSRINGGKDSASPRYIFTKQSDVLPYLIRKEDDPILTYIENEPEYYLPILPLILINGCVGVGTGFSCSIPLFNPEELCNIFCKLLRNQEPDFNLIPWYKNFKGTIREESGKYISEGIIKGREVLELPVGLWTDRFKEMCQDEGLNFKNYSNVDEVKFIFEEDYTKTLRKFIHVSNMVMFDHNNKIVKYDTVKDIILAFYKVRLEWYGTRKDWQISALTKDCEILRNKIRFIEDVFEDTLVIYKQPLQTIIKALECGNYLKVDGTFDYLLHMNLISITKEKLDTLREALKAQTTRLTEYTLLTPQEIWLNELEELRCLL